MPDLDSTVSQWKLFTEHRSLETLRNALLFGRSNTTGQRSASWKALLFFKSLDVGLWPKMLSSSRSAYDALRGHFLQEAKYQERSKTVQSDADVFDNDSGDTLLRTDIKQDVERCMPENFYFAQPKIQRMLCDILFIFCKLNPDVSYRQGMHELVATVLMVVDRDAIDESSHERATNDNDDKEIEMVKLMFDVKYIEHDAFTLFSHIMQSAKIFYEQTTHSATQNPIVQRSQLIFDRLLPQVDPQLSVHLHRIAIVPQVFLLRWIRLLFSREFAFEHVLVIWDIIFSADDSLGLVDMICVTMLLKMRWELMEGDYHSALSLLVTSPSKESSDAARAVALGSIYLRDHLNLAGGSHVVAKLTGRAITLPASLSRSRSNFETMLQSTAGNLLAQGKRIDIRKAVRGAVDEVHRKALEMREDAQMMSQTKQDSTIQGSPLKEIEILEKRNYQLAELLEESVSELLEHQNNVADQSVTVGGGVEQISLAIAKIQFVQIHLRDSTIALSETKNNEKEKPEENCTPSDSGNLENSHAAYNIDIPTPRPSLADSDFGWMVAQEEAKINPRVQPSESLFDSSSKSEQDEPNLRGTRSPRGRPKKQAPPVSVVRGPELDQVLTGDQD